MREELTADDIRRIEARWKSDVDLKLDALIKAERDHREKYDAFIDMLIKREQSRATFRMAIIEKGIIALSIYFVGLLGTFMWDSITQHWKAAVDAAAAVRK